MTEPEERKLLRQVDELYLYVKGNGTPGLLERVAELEEHPLNCPFLQQQQADIEERRHRERRRFDWRLALFSAIVMTVLFFGGKLL